jgi:endoglucanase
MNTIHSRYVVRLFINIYILIAVAFAILTPLKAKSTEVQCTDAMCWNKKIGRGINLGNALEADNEGDWGLTIKKDYFIKIKNAGFDSVRIPIKWSSHISSYSPYLIEPSFFERIDQVITSSLKSGLVTIINVHGYNELMHSPLENKMKFISMWKQISLRYKNYSNKLFFELLNEPVEKLTSDIWNSLAEEVIKNIREENPDRILIIGSSNWNAIDSLEKLNISNSFNIIVTFHFYYPMDFTHQGASWLNGKYSKIVDWKIESPEGNYILKQFIRANQWSRKNNVPLYMGEFGVINNVKGSARLEWIKYVRTLAETYNISWSYWNFYSDFGIFDINENHWDKDILLSLTEN